MTVEDQSESGDPDWLQLAKALDRIFSRFLNDHNFAALDESLSDVEQDFLARIGTTPKQVIQIRGVVRERRLIAAIESDQPIEYCLSLFQDLQKYRYYDDISGWAASALLFCYYLADNGMRNEANEIMRPLLQELLNSESPPEDQVRVIEQFLEEKDE